MNLIRSSCYFLLLLTNLVVAQSNLEPATISDRLAQAQTLEHLREETSGRLDVVTNNIAPEEIDRAVLNKLMEEMQNSNLGYLAVSLGFYKTLFSAPGLSTSSEIPDEERKEMGLSDSLVRISIGIDHDITRTYRTIFKCMKDLEIL